MLLGGDWFNADGIGDGNGIISCVEGTKYTIASLYSSLSRSTIQIILSNAVFSTF